MEDSFLLFNLVSYFSVALPTALVVEGLLLVSRKGRPKPTSLLYRAGLCNLRAIAYAPALYAEFQGVQISPWWWATLSMGNEGGEFFAWNLIPLVATMAILAVIAFVPVRQRKT